MVVVGVRGEDTVVVYLSSLQEHGITDMSHATQDHRQGDS